MSMHLARPLRKRVDVGWTCRFPTLLGTTWAPAGSSSTLVTTAPRPNPIGVSTYSFWRFQDDWKLSIPERISRSADMGFDFVEILEMQMDHYTVSGKTVAGSRLYGPNCAALAAIKRRLCRWGCRCVGCRRIRGFCRLT